MSSLVLVVVLCSLVPKLPLGSARSAKLPLRTCPEAELRRSTVPKPELGNQKTASCAERVPRRVG